METFLLTWNPAQKRPRNQLEAITKYENGKYYSEEWSAGSRKSLPVDSRFFMLRQGIEPRGIIASGYTKTRPKREEDSSSHSLYCKVEYTAILDASKGHLIPLEELNQNPPLDTVNWSTRSGGILLEKEQAKVLEKLWAETLKRLGKKELPPKKRKARKA